MGPLQAFRFVLYASLTHLHISKNEIICWILVYKETCLNDVLTGNQSVPIVFTCSVIQEFSQWQYSILIIGRSGQSDSTIRVVPVTT